MAYDNYEKVGWENGVTPVNAENMTHMEDGIVALESEVTTINTTLNDDETGLILKVDTINDAINNEVTGLEARVEALEALIKSLRSE